MYSGRLLTAEQRAVFDRALEARDDSPLTEEVRASRKGNMALANT